MGDFLERCCSTVCSDGSGPGGRLFRGSFLTIRTAFISVFKYDSYISAFYKSQPGLNLNKYVPQLVRKSIVHPAQDRHYSSNARESHPRVCPNGVGLTWAGVSVPWGGKSITNSSRYNPQRDKSVSYCNTVSV